MKKESIGDLFKKSRILVVGDLILDRFIYGNVKRISPEAPVPVVEVTKDKSALGGAANVANNIKALGGDPVLIGTIGDDPFGRDFMETLKKASIDGKGIVIAGEKSTIVKTRIIAHHQQIVRVDREKAESLSIKSQTMIKGLIEKNLKDSKAIVVSDYAKGFFSVELLKWIGKVAKQARIPYVVDPKPVHFPYPMATIVTPNRGEAQGFLNKPFLSHDLSLFAKELLSKTDWKAVLITLGDEGMALFERGASKVENIPAKVREVYDVTGAGDTVVAVISLALGAKLSIKEASMLANTAAGVVVGKLGTATCSIDELLKSP